MMFRIAERLVTILAVAPLVVLSKRSQGNVVDMSTEACALKPVITAGNVRLPKQACAGAGASLEEGHKLTCTVIFPAPQTHSIFCCSGELTTDPCAGGVVEAIATTTLPPYSEAAMQCAKSDNGEWEKSEGPRVSGGDKQVSADFIRRKRATSDEECRAECCLKDECWGTVRKTGNKFGCWLLFLPTSNLSQGTDPDYYMEAKPPSLCTQRYPYAFPYVYPVDETTVARINYELEIGLDAYFDETFYDAETAKRSIFDKEDRKTSTSYLARSGLNRVELKIFAGGGAKEKVEQDCAKLNAIKGKQVAKCLGTGNHEDHYFIRLEYIGSEELVSGSIPADAPSDLLRGVIKQIILAHLEIIADGYVLRDGLTTFFNIQKAGEDGKTFKLGPADAVVKLMTMSGANSLEETGSDAEAAAAAAALIFNLLLPETLGCSAPKEVDGTSSEMAITSALKKCEAGAVVDGFIKGGGVKMLMGLLNATAGKSALEAALKTKYLNVKTPDPDDRRLLLQRSFEACKPSEPTSVLCSSGDKRTAKLLGCKEKDTNTIGGYVIHDSLCEIGTQSTGGKKKSSRSRSRSKKSSRSKGSRSRSRSRSKK